MATIRLDEARTLLRNGKYDGCYYLTGYAVECGLKACIAKLTKRHDFPDKDFAVAVHSHKLHSLLDRANLTSAKNPEANRNSEFGLNWYVVGQWSEQSRYQTQSRRDAEELFAAVADRKNGVFRWIKRHW